jgi:hypothetical protein
MNDVSQKKKKDPNEYNYEEATRGFFFFSWRTHHDLQHCFFGSFSLIIMLHSRTDVTNFVHLPRAFSDAQHYHVHARVAKLNSCCLFLPFRTREGKNITMEEQFLFDYNFYEYFLYVEWK